TDVEDQTALDNFDHGTGDNTVFLLDFFDVAPSTLVLCAFLGETEAAFFIFLGKNQRFYGIATLNDFVGIDVVFDGQFTWRDDAFGLIADIEQSLVSVDVDDGACDQVAIVEVFDGLVDCSHELFGRADVIDSDLRGVTSSGHVVGTPIWINMIDKLTDFTTQLYGGIVGVLLLNLATFNILRYTSCQNQRKNCWGFRGITPVFNGYWSAVIH